jgi:hypothetical protein
MSEATHDSKILLDMIDQQNTAIKKLLAERDELRAILEANEQRLDALTCLQRAYNNPQASETNRIKAAGLAVPFERPKLSVTATASVGLFDLLEERRRRSKVIEYQPSGDPAA